MLQRLFFILSILFLLGCSQQLKPQLPAQLLPQLAPQLQQDPVIAHCQQAIDHLDTLTAQHTGTLIGERINGTPWLRSDRLIQYFIHHESVNESNLDALLNRMSELASQALIGESVNLPQTELSGWQATYSITDQQMFIHHCNEQLSLALLDNPPLTLRWLRHLRTDDDYSDLARIVGLYPLTSIPFRDGVMKEQEQIRSLWARESNSDWNAYSPIAEVPPLNTENYHVDSLGLPALSTEQQQNLLKRYAPTWMISSATTANIPGQPYWQDEHLKVTGTHPASYSFLSLGLFNDRPVLQLNYLTWFSERPADGWPDLLAGQHDAVIFRTHLDLNNQIIAFDSVHLCGCWYTLILEPDQPYTPRTGWFKEPTLIFRSQFSNAMAVYLQPDTHLLIAASPVANSTPIKSHGYELRPFQQLLNLPLPATESLNATRTKAVFNKQGYVDGSQRNERWLFWPMGIKRPGTLRRPGDHAINFIGKLHFDDPLILEKLGVGINRP